MKKYLFTFIACIMAIAMNSCLGQDEDIKLVEDTESTGEHVYTMVLNESLDDFDGPSRAGTVWATGAKIYLKFKKSNGTYIYGTATRQANEWQVTTSSSLDITSSNLDVEGVYIKDPVSVSASNVSMNEKSVLYKGTGSYSHPNSTSIYVELIMSPQVWRMRFDGSSTIKVNLPAADNDIKYYTAFNPTNFNTSLVPLDASTFASTNGGNYIYGVFVNPTGNNKITITTSNENGAFSRSFKGSNLPVGASGYFTVLKSSSLGSWTFINNLDLSISANQLTVIATGAASDFNYGSDVNEFYMAFKNTSDLNGMSDDEIIAIVMDEGAYFPKSELDYIGHNRSLQPSTNCTLCAIAYAADGTRGKLYKKQFTTKSDVNQPEISFSFKSRSSDGLKWNYDVTMNSYTSKFYLYSVSEEVALPFVAWLLDYWIQTDQISSFDDNGGYTSNRSEVLSTLYMYGWACGKNGNMSGIVNSAVFSASRAEGNSDSLPIQGKMPKVDINSANITVMYK